MEKDKGKFKREAKRTRILPEEKRARKAKMLRGEGIHQIKILR